ncbi:type IV pilus biogenesis protein PilM [Chitinimonas naiadis]
MWNILLSYFRRRNDRRGWAAIDVGADGWTLARVSRRGPKPVLRLFETVAAVDMHPGRLSTRTRVTTLLEQDAYRVLQIDAPNVAREELRSAVKWRVKDMLEAHIEHVTLDVVDIPPGKRDVIRPPMMLVVAGRNTYIQEKVAAFRAINVPLEVIDIPELALRNVAALFERNGQAVIMAWFDMDHGMLLVVFEGELYMVRNLEAGAQKLIRDSQERDALLDRIQREVKRTLDHIDRYFRDLSVSHVVIMLPCDPEPVLEALRDSLDLPVELGNIHGVLDGIADLIPDERQQVMMMPLIGAALRDVRA